MDEETRSPAQVAESVVAELAALDDRGLDQHVAAFETAHARLRGLLTDDGHVSRHPAASA